MSDTEVTNVWTTTIKDLGGWGAFVVALVWGGRAFMALASDFSSRVIDELKNIREAIIGQESRVERLQSRVDDVHDQVRSQGERIESILRSPTSIRP
jgi:hypothetical protein